MNQITLRALADFPRQLEAHFTQIPPSFRNWRPASWDGVPSEPFSAVEQICHVRDIEIDGYHERIHRVREESHPTLIREARAKTLALIAQLVHYLCSHDQQHMVGLQWLLGRIAATEAQ